MVTKRYVPVIRMADETDISTQDGPDGVLTPNSHFSMHALEIVRRFGSMRNVSSMPFESFIGFLKNIAGFFTNGQSVGRSITNFIH